jgi:trimeric autotransporter adhesin
MKNKINLFAAAILTLACFKSSLAPAFGQGTAFTYQARLQNNGAPANGRYDLKLGLFPTNQFGIPIGPIVTNTAVSVSNGLFTTILDFGGGVFTGTDLWFDISVRTNGNGAFTELTPRQPVTPTPYAITAGNLAGVLKNNLIQGGTVLATIGGGSNNIIQTGANYSVIGAGHDNFIGSGALSAAIGGGSYNLATAGDATVAGGEDNFASGSWAVVGGGYENMASNLFASVGGGTVNISGGRSATVAGGEGSVASGDWSTVAGGYNNIASGSEATVGGGSFNLASGADSFAAGFEARATDAGTFVWADSQGATFASTATNQFLIRAAGGVGINTASPQQALSVVGGVNIDQNGQNGTGNVNVNGLTFGSGSGEGVASQRTGTGNLFDLVLCTKFLPRLTILQNGFVGVGVTPTTSFQVGLATCNGLTWNNSSDRNLKEDFTAINTRAVLEKVSAMPITEWKYKMEAHGTQHIGPMAQDFHAAFDLNGADDKHISVVDEGGVALAAIQGLNQKVEEQRAELNRKETEISELKKRLDALEKILLNQQSN